MKKIATALISFALIATPVFAHDLFLKLDSFFVGINDKISLKILNGTFQTSEGAVNFARLKDLSVISPDGSRTHPKEADFTKDETTSYLSLQPSSAGTYVTGLATMPRELDLKAKDFNDYLVEDGIPDTLAERKRKKELAKDVRERYSKHVKTLFQVGDNTSANFNVVLGYPVEIIPQTNPYSATVGATISLLCLKDGKPLANQVVMTGYEDASGKLIVGSNLRTDRKGIAKLKLSSSGKWYAKFINMARLKDPKLNYESKWATLTFGVR